MVKKKKGRSIHPGAPWDGGGLKTLESESDF